MPEIYVELLSDGFHNRPYGVWIDATQDPQDIRDEISFMIANSSQPDAEEYEITDYYEFHGLSLTPFTIEQISQIAQGIDLHGEAFAAWIGHVDQDFEEMRFEDYYIGTWKTIHEYARETLDEYAIKPDENPFSGYLVYNYDQFARDSEIELTVLDSKDKDRVFIFHP